MQFTVTSIPANQAVPGLSFGPVDQKPLNKRTAKVTTFSFSKCVKAFKVMTENSAL